MDKIECIRIFVETAQLNSFTATANKLDITQGAVSKKIAWLENDLGITLFQRNSRKISSLMQEKTTSPIAPVYSKKCLA